jgi:carbamoyl-phosphate synthase small subunit
MNGAITGNLSQRGALLEKLRGYEITDAVKSVTIDKKFTVNEKGGGLKIALLDYGFKQNILRSLVARGCEVTVYPGLTKAGEILSAEPDGIMLSNGPGDPGENAEIIANARDMALSGTPIFGICLGHQIMGLAQGAKTAKLKYGHRGANHPVKDLKRDRTYITSQNHGYAVLGDTLDKNIGEVSHVNLNDGTVEGIRYHHAPVFTVQFHPEASPGPRDSGYLFDEF